MAEDEEVAVGRENEEFALTVLLINWARDGALRQSIELWFEFGVEGVHVADVNVIGVATVAGWGSVAVTAVFEETDCDAFALDVGVVSRLEGDRKPRIRVKKSSASCRLTTWIKGVTWMKFTMLTPPARSVSRRLGKETLRGPRHRPEIVTGVPEYFAAGKNVQECRVAVEFRCKALIFNR